MQVPLIESPWREMLRSQMREVFRLRVFRKWMLREMNEPKREEVEGSRMKLHNNRLRDL
jgi:hypothetical protein